MRAITKGPEPRSLTAHRQRTYSDYDNYADKGELRKALVTEQRGLCCYCMGRIRSNRIAMKIEHWQCRDQHREEELTYHNLLGACLGGTEQPPGLQHCDTKKGDRDLQWNPSDPAHYIETRLYYEPDGSIRSSDATFDEQLEEVLNLNLPVLKQSRKGVLDAVLEWWRQGKARLRGPVPRSRFEAERDRRKGGTGELQPFCQVAVWWIELRLARLSA